MGGGGPPQSEQAAAAAERFQQYKLDHPDWYYIPPKEFNAGEFFTRPFIYMQFYIRRVISQFGWQFFALLTCNYLGVKGFLYALINNGQLPYFLNLMGLESTEYQVYSTVAKTPWSMKAIMGLMSDLLPIKGYFKKYYLMMFGMFGTCCCLVTGIWTMPPALGALAAFMFFLGNFQIALSDLLVEGRYAELMVKCPETSSDIVTWVWATYFVGSLAAIWVVGPMSDKYDETGNEWYIKGMFLAGTPFALQLAFPVVLGWLGEVPLPMHQRGFQSAKWDKHRGIFILAIIMGVMAVGGAVVGLLNKLVLNKNLPANHKQLPVFIYNIGASVICVGASYKFMPRGVANAMSYMFYTHAAYLSVSGAMDVFFIGKEKCFPGGPQFDNSYYITWSGTVQAIFGLIGTMVFQGVMSEWEFRPCFWVTTVLSCLAAVVDIVMVERWNISWGIPDKWMYMLGDNIVVNLISMLNFMPGVVLISKLCPRGMESTLYALLAGFSNFGSSVASYLGTYAVNIAGIKMSVNGPCENYGRLGLLLAVCHIFVPLTCIPLTFVLIPKGRLTDPLFVDEFHAKVGTPSAEEIEADVVVSTAPGMGRDGKEKSNMA